MKSSKLVIHVLAVVILAQITSARAFGNAILISDNRSVTTSGSWQMRPVSGTPSSGSWNLSGAPSPLFADFNSKVIAAPNAVGGFLTPTVLDVFAEQISSITSSRFDALGTTHVRVSMNDPCCGSGSATMSGSAASVFEVGFTLAEAHSFQLTTLTLNGQIYLEKVGTGKIVTPPQGFGSVLTTGFLQPGSYILHADYTKSFALLNGEGLNNCCSESYQLSFQLAAVPEPAVVMPLGVSLLCLAISRKRKLRR